MVATVIDDRVDVVPSGPSFQIDGKPVSPEEFGKHALKVLERKNTLRKLKKAWKDAEEDLLTTCEVSNRLYEGRFDDETLSNATARWQKAQNEYWREKNKK